MEKKKKEVRFLLKEEIYNQLKKKAEKLDVPLTSYIKSNMEEWVKIKWKKKNKKSADSHQD